MAEALRSITHLPSSESRIKKKITNSNPSSSRTELREIALISTGRSLLEPLYCYLRTSCVTFDFTLCFFIFVIIIFFFVPLKKFARCLRTRRDYDKRQCPQVNSPVLQARRFFGVYTWMSSRGDGTRLAQDNEHLRHTDTPELLGRRCTDRNQWN